MVPNIIHQIVGPKTNKIVDRCLLSWQQLRGHKFRFLTWNDQNIEIFLGKYYPGYLPMFLNARNHAEAADIARYIIIFHYGGYYMDWDIQLLDKDKFLNLAERHPNGFLLRDPRDGSIASECFSACRNEQYLSELVEDISHQFDNRLFMGKHTLFYSGPFRMKAVLDKAVVTCQTIIDVKEVFLYDYSEIQKMPERNNDKPLIHYWLHSWLAERSE
ncbi:glycosyltransferase [Pedobacter jejuensis]|uniref:Glycosyl transferase n=1 Tax=Pedobacter jejuensis TaxID=1268550 RepID=A0A3N0BZP9_9SPHI|nr:glycosyltransferase [Pedobacter jejuensis]RNL55408.1 hypothetical protein D7004_04830 [Pedobacter jejuensis]